MRSLSGAILDEAYERLPHAGSEWGEDQLTNRGPMAVEVLVRRGHATDVHAWVDAYIRRLDDLPVASGEITDQTWPSALGNGRRIGDWTAYLTRQVDQRRWREVLITWWPRLLPAIVAGTTHGVIRVSHAVRALLAGEAGSARSPNWPTGWLSGRPAHDPCPDSPHPLVSWTPPARWTRFRASPTSGVPWPPGSASSKDWLAGFGGRGAALPHPQACRPVLLVHTATAPNAVLHTLPGLLRNLWAPSLSAVWVASAAIISAYAPTQALLRADLPGAPQGSDAAHEVLERAVTHGDEHVIKFADTAAEVYTRTGNPDALASAIHVGRLIRTGA